MSRLLRRLQSLGVPFRRRRMTDLASLFDLSPSTRVIDVGGYADNWRLIPDEPSVLLVNLEKEEWTSGRFSKVQGDGRSLNYPDNSFDLAYSNSVIEHVGSWSDQIAFANEIRRVSKNYYIQTPYRHFPIEAHTFTPFVQYLPSAFAKRLFRWCTVWGLLTRPGPDYVAGFVDALRLLNAREFSELFPDAAIRRERAFGLTKSLIAVRRDTAGGDAR